MYTTDQIRAEALKQVMQCFIERGLRPAEQSSADAWSILASIAREHPDWRTGQYYWHSGDIEQLLFMSAFEAWKRSVNEIGGAE